MALASSEDSTQPVSLRCQHGGSQISLFHNKHKSDYKLPIISEMILIGFCFSLPRKNKKTLSHTSDLSLYRASTVGGLKCTTISWRIQLYCLKAKTFVFPISTLKYTNNGKNYILFICIVKLRLINDNCWQLLLN